MIWFYFVNCIGGCVIGMKLVFEMLLVRIVGVKSIDVIIIYFVGLWNDGMVVWCDDYYFFLVSWYIF